MDIHKEKRKKHKSKKHVQVTINTDHQHSPDYALHKRTSSSSAPLKSALKNPLDASAKPKKISKCQPTYVVGFMIVSVSKLKNFIKTYVPLFHLMLILFAVYGYSHLSTAGKFISNLTHNLKSLNHSLVHIENLIHLENKTAFELQHANYTDYLLGPVGQNITKKELMKLKNLQKHFVQPIKFYIYDAPETQWLENLTRAGWGPDIVQHSGWMHGDDVLFLKKAEKHPWRTLNPNSADIFVIPILLGFLVDDGYGNYNTSLGKRFDKVVYDDVNMIDMAEITGAYIWESPFFKKNKGSDHLVVCSHWRIAPTSRPPLEMWKRAPNIRRVLHHIKVANYEIMDKLYYNTLKEKEPGYSLETQYFRTYTTGARTWLCTIVTPYVDDGEALRQNRELTFEKWQERHYDYLFVGKALYRQGYATRRNLAQSFADGYFEDLKYILAIFDDAYPPDGEDWAWHPDCYLELCMDRCANCKWPGWMTSHYQNYSMDTKFSLMIHGDSPTSARLYESIANGQIPIIISSNIYVMGLPFISRVPWTEFTFFVSQSEISKQELARMIRRIRLDTPEYILRHMYDKLLTWRKHLLWNHPESLVFEHILEEAKDTCRL